MRSSFFFDFLDLYSCLQLLESEDPDTNLFYQNKRKTPYLFKMDSSSTLKTLNSTETKIPPSSLINSRLHPHGRFRIQSFNAFGWYHNKGFKEISQKILKKGISYLDQVEILVDMLNNLYLPKKLLIKLLSQTKVCRSFRIDSSVFQIMKKRLLQNKLHRFFRTVTRGNLIEHFPYLNINRMYNEANNLSIKFLYKTLNISYMNISKLLSHAKWSHKIRRLSEMKHLKNIKITDDKYTDYANLEKVDYFKRFKGLETLALEFRSNSMTGIDMFASESNAFWSKITKLTLLQFIGDSTQLLHTFMVCPNIFSSLKVFEFRDNVTKNTDISSLSRLEEFPQVTEIKLNLHGFHSNLFDIITFPQTIQKLNLRLSMSGFSRFKEVLKGKALFPKLGEFKFLREISLVIYFMTTTFFHPDNNKAEITNYFLSFLENLTPDLTKLSLNCGGNEDYFANEDYEDSVLLSLISKRFRKLSSMSLIIPQLILRYQNITQPPLELNYLSISLAKYPREIFLIADPKHLNLNILMKDALNPDYWEYFNNTLQSLKRVESLEVQFAAKSRALWKPNPLVFESFVGNIIQNFQVPELFMRIPPIALLSANLKNIKEVVEKTKKIRRFILVSLKYTLMRQGPFDDVILTYL